MPGTDSDPMRVRAMTQSFFVKILIVFSFLSFSPCLSFASSDGYVDSILEALLRDTHPVSYEAEEVVIFFSESEAPRVHRYRTGVFKPYKMRRESYAIDWSVEDVMVHDSEMQIVYYPSEKIVVRSPREKIRDSQIVGEMLTLIKANYDVHIEGEARVSGRKVSIVSIMPKKRGTRPGFKVWLDRDYLLPLKTETYDLKGNISYQNTYRKLAINPFFKQDYFVIMVPPGTVAYESASSSAGNPKDYEMPGLQQVPGGYVLKEALKGEDGHFQIIYHDGLNSISVFSEDWNESEGLSAEKMFGRSGATVEIVTLDGLDAFFCRRGTEGLMRFVSEGHKYTVVGEISKEGLIEISLDIKRRSLKR
jgi:negative regulator of sigma E activity